MSDENNIISIAEAKARVHLHSGLNKRERIPKPMHITEGEAKILAEDYLKLIYSIHLCARRCGSSIWEHNMYAYAHQRLEMLIDSGLITYNFIGDWREANVVPVGDPSDSHWRDRNLNKDCLSDKPFPDIDPDDDIPF